LSQREQSPFDNSNQQQNSYYPASPAEFIEPWLLDSRLNPHPEFNSPRTQDSLQNYHDTFGQTFHHFRAASSSQSVNDAFLVPSEQLNSTRNDAEATQIGDSDPQDHGTSQISCPECSRPFRIPRDLK
jgi:hypothetical protein